MFYHTVKMTIFSSLLVPRPGSNEQAFAEAESAKKICLSSASAVRKLLEIQRSNWGLDPMPLVNMQWIVVALFNLLNNLNDPDYQFEFLELCKAAIFPARRWLLLKGMFRLVQITARQKHENLPVEIKRLFNDFERKYWKAEDKKRFSSSYPVFATAIRERDDYLPDDFELDTFLEKWDDLRIAEE